MTRPDVGLEEIAMSRSRSGRRPSRASARALVATAGLACLGLLAACTSSSTPSASSSGNSGGVHITLSHGYTDVEAKAITAQVKEWNASHPKIQVTLVYNTGNDNALQKTIAG